MVRFLLLSGLCFALTAVPALADPCRSGPTVDQRPGPYSFLVSTGSHRGQPHCFICETEDRPAVIIFARSLSDPLGKLVRRLDAALNQNRKAELRSWVTFLAEDQPTLDPKVVEWAQKHAISNVPLGIFQDLVGPPTYLLNRDADVTVLLSVKQRVVANFAFRTGELNNKEIHEIIKSLPKILK